MLQPRAGVAGVTGVVLAWLLGASGCGGASRTAPPPPAPEPAAETAGTPGEPDEPVQEPQAELIPAETLDQIRSFFERKNKYLSRCFLAAIDAEELPKNIRNTRLTMTVTITPEGALENFALTGEAASSPVLDSCVRERASQWILPQLPQPLDYSHTFRFSTL